MPFSDTEHGTNKRKITELEWAHIFEHWIKKAVESFQPVKMVCKRSPAIPGNFVKGIVEDLDSSELVIADLTGSKPNVYYELGVRHALRIGTILITQDLEALPSDLKNYYAFGYNYSKKGYEYEGLFQKFEKQLHEKIQAWFDSDSPSDSPVSDFLGIINQRMEKEMNQEKEELKYLLIKLKQHFAHNFETSEIILDYLKRGQPKELKDSEKLPIIDVFAMDIVYMRIIGYGWKHFKYIGILDALEQLILPHRRLFNEIITIWNVLYANPQEPMMSAFLVERLKPLSGRKKEFEDMMDKLIAGVDAVKLRKQILTHRRGATPEISPAQSAGSAVRK
jgi:hypothetical protein